MSFTLKVYIFIYVHKHAIVLSALVLCSCRRDFSQMCITMPQEWTPFLLSDTFWMHAFISLGNKPLLYLWFSEQNLWNSIWESKCLIIIQFIQHTSVYLKKINVCKIQWQVYHKKKIMCFVHKMSSVPHPQAILYLCLGLFMLPVHFIFTHFHQVPLYHQHGCKMG